MEGLTSQKMGSYLVVNTLKLGFIVQLYFNYDLTYVPVGTLGDGNRALFEKQLFLMVSISYLTGFFLLFTSIWFSMHAAVVANTFMTKVLIQTARIPLPDDEVIRGGAPRAADFETSLGPALRVPLLAECVGAVRDASGWSTRETQLRHCSTQDVERLAAHGHETSARELREGAQKEEDSQSASDLSKGALPSTGVRTTVAPHLKFYARLMLNWLPFDLYSKISMAIGTSSLVAGISYYSVFFALVRLPAESNISNQVEWYTFVIMVMLQWWCVMLDLSLNMHEHMICVLLVLSGPTVLACAIVGDVKWLVPLSFLCQASWFWFLAWSALQTKSGWPKRWQASYFLNIMESTAPKEVADAANWLLRCLDAALENQALPWTVPQTQLLSQARFLLNEAKYIRETERGPDQSHQGSEEPSGFWLQISEDTDIPPHWVPLDGEDSSPECVHLGTVEELALCARKAASLLRSSVGELSLTEVGELADYGGHAPDSAKVFEAQFRSKGAAAKFNLGHTAHLFFRLGLRTVSVVWVMVLCLVTRDCAVHSAISTWSSEPLRVFLTMPRPWFKPTMLSCDHTGQQVTVGDGVRAFTGWINGGGDWIGPLLGCGGEDVVGFSYGLHGLVGISRNASSYYPLQLELTCNSELYELGETVDALALETGGDGRFRGIALRDNQILVLEELNGSAEIVGRLDGRSWVAATLRAGRVLALDGEGLMFELDTETFLWCGPYSLQRKLSWSSICALPDGGSLVLGKTKSGEAEVWRFSARGLD